MSQQAVKEALGKTIAAIQQNPNAANLVFRAETQLHDRVRCSAKVRHFDVLTIDEPPELGGLDAGMNPVELMLVALGTCQEIMYSAYASVMGIPLNSVKVDLKGYLDSRGLLGMADCDCGYKNIRFETHIDSPASPEEIQKLIATVETHCPVMDTLVRPVEVSGKAYLNGKKMDAVAQVAAS